MTHQKTAVIYVRCSTYSQLAKSSLDRQYRICKKWCAENNVTIMKVLADVGSGYDGYHLSEKLKSPKKGNLGRWMRSLKDGWDIPDYFLYEEMDRLSMSPFVYVDIRADLKSMDIEPKRIGLPFDVDWKEPLTYAEAQQIYMV